jgi:hypothetical protein
MVLLESAKAVPEQDRQGEKKPANPEGLQVVWQHEKVISPAATA